mgnify:CR=1 FL=1
MNVLDLILIILLVIAGISGFRKGVITQICGIAGLLLGILLAFRFSDWLSRILNIGESFSWLLSFIIILIVVVLVLYWAGWLVKKLVHVIGLGILDRLGGFILGVVKWGLVFSLLLGLLVNFTKTTKIVEPEVITGSRLYPPLKKLGDWVFPYILDAKEKYVDPELQRDREPEEPEPGSDSPEADDFRAV